MASALFASRNETPPHWGERERNVYMRKTPNNSAPIGPPTSTAPAAAASSSNPNPNNHNNSSSRHYPGPSSALPSSNRRPSPLNGAVGLGGLGGGGGAGDLEPPEDCSSFSHKGGNGGGGPNHHHNRHNPRHVRGEPEPGGYVAFRVAEFNRAEIRDLRRRLASELERVREISTWIGSRDLYSGSGAVAAARSVAGSASESYDGVREAWEVTSSSGPPRQGHPKHQHQQSSWEHPSAAPRFDGSKDHRGSAGPKSDPASRLPPAESQVNRKGSGTKRPPPSQPFARDPKRPHTSLPAPAAPSGSEVSTPSSELMKQCSQILTKLMKHKHGWVFNRPVDAVGMGLHDYHQIVKRPMDLGTVKSKLKKKAYGTPPEFATDVRLTFNNALLYNPEGHDVNTMAGQMLRLFEDLYGPAIGKYEKEERRSVAPRDPERVRTSGGGGGSSGHSHAEIPVSAPMGRVSSSMSAAAPMTPVGPPPAKPVPISRPHPPPPPPAAYQPPPPQPPHPVVAAVPSRSATTKLPKPKAKDPNKREMTYEEKQKLSVGLQSLPDEKMTQVLQIVRRRNPDPAQDGDEIELDFEALDTETLWELDRFVNNCRKLLSKMRRQEAIAAAAGGSAAGVGGSSAGTSQSASSNKADDGKVDDAGEHQQQTHQQQQQQQQQRDAPAEPSMVNKNRRPGGGEAGEDDVDIGEDMPSTHFPSVEIERDEEREEDNSSSSSDSSSGSSSSSSSSDSDSGSSSDSDSDADDARSPAPGSRPQAPPR